MCQGEEQTHAGRMTTEKEQKPGGGSMKEGVTAME